MIELSADDIVDYLAERRDRLIEYVHDEFGE